MYHQCTTVKGMFEKNTSSKDNRVHLKVEESVGNEFRDMAMITGQTHSELLRLLMSQRITQCTTVKIEPKDSSMLKRIEGGEKENG